MSLSRDDFDAFFAETHRSGTGPDPRPYDWQQRLLDAVLHTGRWPGRLVAPTGAGKTAVIDVHVFAQALTAPNDPRSRPPRRLSLVVGRRVLVDDQYEYALALAARLAAPSTPVMREVAARLWQLHPCVPGDPTDDDPGGVSPLVVGRLRGGRQAARAWRDHPTAATVLCATPDMWGSRALFRGYGASWKAWPREAGLLAFDSVLVVDEAHLSPQFLVTSRRVGELAVVATEPLDVPALQVVETTATPAESGDSTRTQEPGSGTELGVSEQDLRDEGLLSRLTRPKPVRLVPVPGWAGTREAQRRKVASAMADAVLDLLLEGGPPSQAPDAPAGTVGCFVNTVSRALDVAAELRGRAAHGRSLRVVTVCGQIRPIDLDRLALTYPGLLTPTGNPEVDVVVSTQSLEVGVDLDLAGMVTDLAAAPALAQRAGRVNRRGLRDAGPVVVLVPEEPLSDQSRSGPYEADALRAALDWVTRCAEIEDGLAPWRLRDADLRPPAAQPRRPWLQRPELAHAWHWARTSDDLAAEPELDLWLSEDFQDSSDVTVAVRRVLPVEPAAAIELVTALPPRPYEQFPVPYRTAVAALRRWDAARTAHLTRRPEEPRPEAVVVRGEDVAVLTWRDPNQRAAGPAGSPPEARDEPLDASGRVPALRPGDVIVVDDREAIFTSSRASVDGGFSPPVVTPSDSDERLPAEDVLTAPADLDPDVWRRREVGEVVLRLEPDTLGEFREWFAVLAVALHDVTTPVPGEAPDREPGDAARQERTVLRDWLVDSGLAGRSPMAAAAVRLLDGAPSRCELVVHATEAAPDDPDENATPIARVILLDRRRPADEDLRQVWTPSAHPVTLAAHQQAVGERASHIASRVGLSPQLGHALQAAGEHHDDGKQDDRFQRRLGRRGAEPLAKSDPRLSPEQARRGEARSGLPSRWRHEQRSVLDCWVDLHADPRPLDPLLVARLVGTSHGHGRSGFPHSAAELIAAAPDDVAALAVDLFNHGGWDDLVERTQERYGVWACAYLEALVRAADCQVSQEGS